MMRRMRRPLVLLLILGSACGKNNNSPDAAPDSDPFQDAARMVPVFRNAVTLPDDQLALQALQIIGANVQGAAQEGNGCHGMTRQHLRYWRALSDTSMTSCLTDLSVSSQES